ncbi:MAG: DUF58 domain-containing protein [Burkholderiales bacterium]|nr:DUF58 domain-containing protein [Burkholderiales bacterium]
MSLSGRLQAWWQSRLPLTDNWLLGQRNIYIVPTRAGFLFAGTLVVMLIAAINYQLNLGYALTFLLCGAALVSMHMTHANLRGLTLHLRPPPAVHAGEPALLEIVVTNPGRDRPGLALRFLDRGGVASAEAPGGVASAATAASTWCDVPALGRASAHLSLVPPRRGWHAVPSLVVETDFPFGLFRAWTIWRPAGRVLAWPRPEEPPPPLPASAAAAGESGQTRVGSGSELDGVRPWRRGDSMRQVAWKKVARSGEMVSRETAGSAARELWLDWGEARTGDTEARLSRLASWVLQAERAGLPGGLRLPGATLAPGLGDTHRRAALELLALWR